ncbi:MAG: hypothetical protein ABWK01_03160 [Infirmifilum sp.]
MDREALSDQVKTALLSIFTITVLGSILALLQNPTVPLRITTHTLNILPQADMVDLNSQVYLNSTDCVLKINNLVVFGFKKPVLVFSQCAVTAINGSWFSITREGDRCLVSLKPMWIASNATLIVYNATFNGWTDRICLEPSLLSYKVYSPFLSICGFQASIEGPTEVKVKVFQVKRC